MLMIVKLFGLITIIKSEWLTSYGYESSYGMMFYAVYFITSLIKIDATLWIVSTCKNVFVKLNNII